MQKIFNLFSLLKENSRETRDTLTLYMNYLAVTYAFVLPITWKGKSTIFIFILLLFFARRNFIYYLKESFANPIVKAFLLYLLVHFLWLFGTENFDQAKKMIDYAKFAIIPLVFLTFLTKEFAHKVIAGFVSGIFLSELLSYLVRFQFFPPKLDLFTKNLYTISDINNPTPFLYHMHYTVSLSIVIAFFVIQLLNRETSLKLKIISILFISTATINLSLVGGRSGYLSYVVLLLTVVLLKFKRKALVPLLITTLLISAISYTAYNNSPVFKYRINQSLTAIETSNTNIEDYTSSLGVRLGFWVYGSKVIENNLLFGVGTGDQMDEVRAYIPSNQVYVSRHPHLHSVFLSQLVQFGIIGFFVYLNIFFQIFRYKYKDEYSKEIAFVISIGIIIATLTETFYIQYYLPVFVTIITATLAKNNLNRLSIKINDKKELKAYFSIFVITSLLIFFQ